MAAKTRLTRTDTRFHAGDTTRTSLSTRTAGTRDDDAPVDFRAAVHLLKAMMHRMPGETVAKIRAAQP